MLRLFQIARLAFQHSPEREQRLVSFANTGTPDPSMQLPDDAEKTVEPHTMDAFLANVELTERQKFHDAVFSAIDTESQQKVLQEYLPAIREKIGTVNENSLDAQKLDEVMQLTRMSIVEDLNREEVERNQLAKAIGDINPDTATDEELANILAANRPIIDRYFTIRTEQPSHTSVHLLQALLAKDVERVRQMRQKQETGVTWNCMRGAEFEELYRKLRKIPRDENVRVPNAFSTGTTMFFNIDHTDFRGSNADTLATRAVAHEAAHLALHNAEPRFGIGQWSRMLKSHARWNELDSAVKEVFRKDPAYLSGKNIELVADEALAIFVADKARPFPEKDGALQNPQHRVCRILDSIFQDPASTHLNTLRKQLESTVSRYTEIRERNGSPNAPRSVGALVTEAAQENTLQKELAEKITKPKSVLQYSEKDGVHSVDIATNADDLEDVINESFDVAGKDAKKMNAGQLRGKSETLLKKIDSIRAKYPHLKEIIQKQKLDPKRQQELLAITEQNLEFLSRQATDLIHLGRNADLLDRWETPTAEGGPSREEKSAFAISNGFASNPYQNLTTDMQTADAECARDRENALNAIREPIAWMEPIFDDMLKELEAAEGSSNPEQHEGGSVDSKMTVGQWLKKNVFSSEGDVVWLTPLNIMNIIKSYKEAIVQNYNSNQKVKENKVAKKINIYKPIQHTLNQLARSTNNKESSEFKEYIEKEGFTFNEVFGHDGKGLSSGLLCQNRHNFNRAKAVLEYAADKAWLYFLDPHNGRNVYGIDFEGVEGHQSFEELVQQHESGKSHQIDHGHERVDKYSDVVPIMDTLVHELRQKNIFAVQGIMKRLQDKAKFSHSNTWMLTTLLMLIRDESKDDPTLLYCLDIGMIDNISNHTIQQSAWSVTWLKMKRGDIATWKNTTKTGKDGFGNNILTATMEKIERKLEECGAHYPPNDPKARLSKYEAIGFVLAGKTLHLNNDEAVRRGIFDYGWNSTAKISIFDSEYADYREAYSDLTSQSTCSPKETDNDYFNAECGGSDIMLLNQTGIEKILIKDSTGKWTLAEKAVGFFSQVFARYDELEELDPITLKNYETEMRQKLSYWWMNTDDSRKNQFHANEDQYGKKIYIKLLERKLLDKKSIANLKKVIKKNFIDALDASEQPEEQRKLDALVADAMQQ